MMKPHALALIIALGGTLVSSRSPADSQPVNPLQACQEGYQRWAAYYDGQMLAAMRQKVVADQQVRQAEQTAALAPQWAIYERRMNLYHNGTIRTASNAAGGVAAPNPIIPASYTFVPDDRHGWAVIAQQAERHRVEAEQRAQIHDRRAADANARLPSLRARAAAVQNQIAGFQAQRDAALRAKAACR